MIDYEEMMLQVSDVMRQANRVRPIVSHEEAINAIREIVTPKSKWKLVEHGKNIDIECPFCGYERGNLSYGYTIEEILKQLAKDDTMLTKFCEMCGADLRGDL